MGSYINLKAFRKGNGLTQGELGDYLGLGKSFISKIEHGKEKIPESKLKKLVENDKGWDMTALYTEPDATVMARTTGCAAPCSTSEMVPVIPENLYKEVNVDILEYLSDGEHRIRTSPAVQQFPRTTCFYVVHTIAMYPHLHEGDILALKALPPTAPIVNGELYAVDTSDLGLVIRFAYDRGDCIEMKSSQERFETFKIKKDSIYSVFRIVGLIRSNI